MEKTAALHLAMSVYNEECRGSSMKLLSKNTEESEEAVNKTNNANQKFHIALQHITHTFDIQKRANSTAQLKRLSQQMESNRNEKCQLLEELKEASYNRII